jgi:ketosteroid isomerase-like protein
MASRSKYLILSSVALTAGACSRVASPNPELSAQDSTAIRDFAEHDAERVLGRDWTTLTALYEADAVRLQPNGPVLRGRAAIRAWFDSLPPITGFSFRLVDFQGQGSLAFMHGAWTITVTPPGLQPVSDSGKILIVLRKQIDGSWRRAADAWNSDLPVTR